LPTLSEIIFDFGSTPGDLLTAINNVGAPGFSVETTPITGTVHVLAMNADSPNLAQLNAGFAMTNPFAQFIQTNYTGINSTGVIEAFIGAELTTTVNNAPEPSSLALLAAGLGFLGLARRRSA
jgi:hypothetical protein